MAEKFWYTRAAVRGTSPRRVIAVQCDCIDRALYIKEKMRGNPLLHYALVLDHIPTKKSLRERQSVLRVLTVQEYERMVSL